MYTSPTTIGLYLIKLRQVRVMKKIQSELNQRVVWSTNLLLTFLLITQTTVRIKITNLMQPSQGKILKNNNTVKGLLN